MRDLIDRLIRIDDSPDMEGAADAVRHQNQYHLEIIDELLVNACNLSQKYTDTLVRWKLQLGPIPDGPRPEKDKMILHIKEEFLMKLREKKIIDRVKIHSESIVYDKEFSMPTDVITASFSYIPSVLIEKLVLIKKSLEEVQLSKQEEKMVDSTIEVSRLMPQTKIKDQYGYLILPDGQEVRIGKSSTGKFKLADFLCNPSFGIVRTIDSVFSHIRSQRHKNDTAFADPRIGKANMLSVIRYQFKEIQRLVNKHKVKNKAKSIGFTIRTHKNEVWFE